MYLAPGLALSLAAALGPPSAVALRFGLGQDEAGPPPGSQPPPVVVSPGPPPAPPPAPAPWPPPPPVAPAPLPLPAGSPVDAGTRLLFGVGLHAGGSEDYFSGGNSMGAVGVGLYLRLGVQANDAWGVEGEISAGTLLVTDYLRGALTADFSPSDWFTVAFGPLVRADVITFCNTETAQIVGATLRADFHVGATRSTLGRSALDLGLVGDLGMTVGGNNSGGSCALGSGGCGAGSLGGPGVAWGLYFTVGWAKY